MSYAYAAKDLMDMDTLAASLVVQHYDCRCFSPGHTLRFTLDEVDNRVFIETYLNSFGLWRRIGMALRYILRQHCELGQFECFELQPRDVHRLRSLLGRVRQ